MASDLNTEIKIGADASGVEAGVSRAKRSLKDLGDSAKKAGQDAGAGIGAIGSGGDKAAKDVERATKNIQGQLQRAIASFDAGEKGSRKFYESLARQRGADVNTLKPLLDQLDAYKSKSEAAAQASAKVGTSFTGLSTAAGLAARAMAAIGITASVGEFVRMADASTNVASRLGLVTSSAAELANVQQRLFGIAQSSRVSFTDLVGTYAQVARSTKDLGVSQTALLGVIQTISQAVTISGGSAASAQAALVQLSQGFAAGALRGEELNSIMEQTPRLAQAIADGMGVSVGKLRELGQAGALTAEAVLGALEKSAAGVAAEFGKMAVTVEQASTNAANSVLRLVGAFDRLLGVTSAISGAIQTISNAVDFLSSDVEKLGNQGPLRDAAREVINLNAAAERLRTGMASGVLGPNAQGELDRINARLAEAKQRFRELDQQLSGVRDPRDQSGFTGRGTSYANEAARQAKLREDANAFRLNQAGVPASYLKDMAELIRLNQAGVIVGKEYTDALKKQQDELLKKTGAVKSSNAAANQEQNAYESLIASIRAKIEADNLEIAGGAALTESQRIRIKLDQDLAAGRVKLSAQNERAVRLALEELAASEASALAAKTLAKANLDAAASREKYLTSLSTGLDKIKADTAAQLEATARMGLSKEAIADLDAAKLEMLATDLELQAIKAMDRNLDEQTYSALKQQAEAYRELAAAKKAGATKEMALDLEKANREAAKKAADEWQRAADDINRSLTDALMRGFESGKDFAENLRDTVSNMFKTMVLRPTISAILAPVAGGVTGLLGLSGAANAGQGAGSLMGMASNASSAYNLVSGGLNVASQAGTWLSGKGTELALQYMGESAGTLLNNFALGMSSTSSMSAASAALQGVGADIAGLAVGSVLNGFSGYGISSALSGGYSAGGWVNTVAGIASAIPGVGPIAGVVGGVVNRAFGRKHTQTNLQGTFGGTTGFEGQWEDYYKGGWFRSSKSVYSPLDEETRGALAGQFNAMRVATAAMADVLGLGTDAISNFTASVNIKLKGLSAEDAQKKIQEEFDKIAESLARQTLGSDAFSRAGESSVQTLTRLSSSLTTVNSAFKLLDIEAWSEQFTASLTGGKNASDYLGKFGGAEVFSQLTASYYDAFYSEAEKTANVTKYITEILASVGLAMPTTREAFRDLTNEYLAMGIYGAETAAVLLAVSGAFASVTQAAEAAAQAERERASTLRGSFGALSQSLADMRGGVADADARVAAVRMDIWTGYNDAQQKVIDLEKQAADATRSFAQSLRGFVSDLATGPNSGLGLDARYQMLGQQFNATAARAGAGDQGARDALTGVAGAYLDVARANARTSVEYARDAARVSIQLNKLATAAESDPLVQKYDAQNLTLQQQIADAQIDVVKYLALMEATGTSTDLGIQTVDKTLAQLRDEYVAATQAQAAANLKLDVALAALDALGLTEDLVNAIAANQTNSLSAALNITDEALSSITGALGLTPENVADIGQQFGTEVALLVGQAATDLAAAIGGALAFDPTKFDALRTIVGYDTSSPNFEALHTILGFDLESDKFRSLQTILGLSSEASAQVDALMAGIGFAPDAAGRADALAGGIGFTGAAVGQIDLIAGGLGISDALVENVKRIAEGVSFSDAAQQQLGQIAQGVGFTDSAAAQAAQLTAGLSFADVARKQIALIAAGVSFAAPAQDQINTLASGVSLSSVASAQVNGLLNGLTLSPAAAEQVGGLLDGLKLSAVDRVTIERMLGGIGFDPDTSAALQDGLGLQQGLLPMLGTALGLSAEAQKAIGVLSSMGTIDQTVRNAYAMVGRSGIGTDVSQIDQQGYDYWTKSLATGAVSMSDFTQQFLLSAAAAPDEALRAYIAPYMRKLGIPGFAVGTNYVPYDMVAQIHKGEMIVPAPYNPSTSGMGSEAVVAELRRVNDQLARVTAELSTHKAELQAIKGASNQTSRVMAGIESGGIEVATKAA